MQWTVRVLRERRDQILSSWLRQAQAQPFHESRPRRAVSDDIPRIFDEMVALLERGPSGTLDAETPLDDPEMVAAAESHAVARSRQGLSPSDVLTEFQLLRREVRRALRAAPSDDVGAGLVAELFVIDVMDEVISVGLKAFADRLAQERSTFLATTMHELRHPLAGMHGRAQMIQRLAQRQPIPTDRLVSSAQTIEAEADRMNRMLTALVESSRAEMGQIDVRKGKVDVRQIASRALVHLDPVAAARVRIVSQPGDDLTVPGDGERLEHVLVNLLTNAVKYAPDSSPIEVRVDGDDDTVELEVRDQGIGIDPEELPHLFQRFRRTKDAAMRGIEGAGLGLFLTRAIVEAHEGRVWAESAGLGQGTSVRASLPRRRDPSVTPP